MLNKELLLGSNSNITHTHVLHVGIRTTGDGIKCYGIEGDGFLEPAGIMINGVDVRVRLINTCYNPNGELRSARFDTWQYSPVADLYLGRADDKKVSLIKAVDTGYQIVYDIYAHNVLLFSKDDLGKDIPLWMSTTPPQAGTPSYRHSNLSRRLLRRRRYLGGSRC